MLGLTSSVRVSFWVCHIGFNTSFPDWVIWGPGVRRGQRVSGRRLRLMDLSIKRELILPTLSHSAWLRQSGEGIPRSSQHRANSLALEITFCNGFESGSALLIDQSKGNKADNLQTRSRKPVEFVSFPAKSIAMQGRYSVHESRLLLWLYQIANCFQNFWFCFIIKHSENHVFFYSIVL